MSQEFLVLLSQLTCPENVVRTRAEQTFSTLKSNKGQLFVTLLEVVEMTNSQIDEHIRHLATVLMRPLYANESDAASFTDEGLHRRLLSALERESSGRVRSMLATLVGELGSILMAENTQISALLLNSVYSLIQSTDPENRISGLMIFGAIAPTIGDTLIVAHPQMVQTVINMFGVCLRDVTACGRVVGAAMSSLSSLLLSLSQESSLDLFSALVEPVIGGIYLLLQQAQQQQQQQEQQQVQTVLISYLECLVELADAAAVYFSSCLLQVCEAVFSLLEQNLPHIRNESTQGLVHMLLEFVVTLAVSIPKRIRKLKPNNQQQQPQQQQHYYMTRLVPLCLQLMHDVKDDPAWETAQQSEDSEQETNNADVGEAALDRVTHALGVTATFAVMNQQFATLLAHNDNEHWLHIYVGFIALGNYLEVTAKLTQVKELFEHQALIVNAFVKFSSHPHARCRNAVFYAMTIFFQTHFETVSHELVAPLFSLIMTNLNLRFNSSPRLLRQVLICLLNVIEKAQFSFFVHSHLEGLLLAVTQLLRQAPPIVQELCISVLSVLMESKTPLPMDQYYGHLMPILKQFLEYTFSKIHMDWCVSLWGQTLECCTLLGERAGPLLFHQDALEMVAMLSNCPSSLSIAAPQLIEDIELRKYIMKTWVRLARCLGTESLTFVPVVVTRLLEAITQDLSAGTGDVDMEKWEEQSDIEMVETNDGWKAVRTSAVEEQATCCQLMMLLVEKLQEHYYPFVEKSMQAMTSMMRSPHEDVQSYALVILSELVRCVGKATKPDRQQLKMISLFSIQLVLEALRSEDVLELLLTGLQALKLILLYSSLDWSPQEQQQQQQQQLETAQDEEAMMLSSGRFIPYLEQEQMEGIVNGIKIVLRESLQRRAILRAEAQVSGEIDEQDAEDEQSFMKDALQLHYGISEILGMLFKTHSMSFLPIYFNTWHETIMEMNHDHCLKEDRQFALYVLSDLLEFGGSSLQQSNQALFTTVFNSVVSVTCQSVSQHNSSSVRQASAYLLGVACRLSPTTFAPHVFTALQSLQAAINQGDEQTTTTAVNATVAVSGGESSDNAIASVGIILQAMEAISFSNANLNYSSLYNKWLDYLPLTHAVDEGKKVLLLLQQVLQSGKSTALLDGNNGQKLKQVFVNASNNNHYSSIRSQLQTVLAAL